MTDKQERLETILLEMIETQKEYAIPEKSKVPEMAQALIELWKITS